MSADAPPAPETVLRSYVANRALGMFIGMAGIDDNGLRTLTDAELRERFRKLQRDIMATVTAMRVNETWLSSANASSSRPVSRKTVKKHLVHIDKRDQVNATLYGDFRLALHTLDLAYGCSASGQREPGEYFERELPGLRAGVLRAVRDSAQHTAKADDQGTAQGGEAQATTGTA